MTILNLLTWSDRPIRLEEAIDAIAVRPDEEPGFDPNNRMPVPIEILKICSSLVELGGRTNEFRTGGDENLKVGEDNNADGTKRKLRLAHFSVKEYLVSARIVEPFGRHLNQAAARASLTKICITYLSHVDHGLIFTGDIKARFPLAQYSASYWMSHAKISEAIDEHLVELVVGFMQRRERGFLTGLLLYDPDRPWRHRRVRGEKDQPDALYYASLAGLTQTVKYLLDKGTNVNAPGGHYGNALQAACVIGCKDTIQLLLERKADINAQGGLFGNALQAACGNGHTDTIQLLLERHADVNAQGGIHSNALQAACAIGHTTAAKLLLERKANINAQGGYFSNALQAACAEGRTNTVRLLLDRNADVNVQGGHFGNALQVACKKGYNEIVQLLLDRNADINAQGGFYSNALQAARVGGHDKIVVMLLARNAGVCTQDGCYNTALEEALKCGHDSIEQMLVEKDANTKVSLTAFIEGMTASRPCNPATLTKLLHATIVIQRDAHHEKTVLHWAAERGFTSIIARSLELGADMVAQDRYGETALHYAAEQGHIDIVKLLVEAGARRDMIDNHGRTPLQCAQGKGPPRDYRAVHLAVVEYLSTN